VFFIAAGYGVRLSFFSKTQFGVILVLFYLWGNAQIALTFFLSAIFTRSRTANIATILLVLCSVIISLTIDTLYPDDPISPAYFLWPPFAFYRALGLVNRASYIATKIVYFNSTMCK
jgi:tryptophan-rich sensory protein